MITKERVLLQKEGKGIVIRCRIAPQSLAIIYNGLMELHRRDNHNSIPPTSQGRLASASIDLLAQAMLDDGLATQPTRQEAVLLVAQLSEAASKFRVQGIKIDELNGPRPSEFTPIEEN